MPYLGAPQAGDIPRLESKVSETSWVGDLRVRLNPD